MRRRKKVYTSIGHRGRRRERLNHTSNKPTFTDPETGESIESTMKDIRGNRFTRWAHDGIARAQNRRQQLILKHKLLDEEWANVPATALSRAQSPGGPEATDTALSVADEPEETRLTIGIEENNEAEVPVKR